MILKHSNTVATTENVSWVLLLPIRTGQNEDPPSKVNKPTPAFRWSVRRIQLYITGPSAWAYLSRSIKDISFTVNISDWQDRSRFESQLASSEWHNFKGVPLFVSFNSFTLQKWALPLDKAIIQEFILSPKSTPNMSTFPHLHSHNPS